MRLPLFLLTLMLECALWQTAWAAVATIDLSYLSPDEARTTLGLLPEAGAAILELPEGRLQVRLNPATNQLLLAGDATAIAAARELVAALDVPPRQIVIEARIVEINLGKARELGLDWQTLLDNLSLGTEWGYNAQSLISDDETGTGSTSRRREDNGSWDKTLEVGSSYNRVQVGQMLRLVEESGAGEVKNMPQILTINNRLGEILDGSHVVYAARYANRSELFETEELSSGLYLGVTPSLGAGGLLTLDVTAKLTELLPFINNSTATPLGEQGQIVKNRVLTRDGQTVLLGGLRRTEIRKETRRVPVLGWVLPFLFSRQVDVDISRDVLILLTPRVVDLNVPQALNTGN
jgi:type II secretory pathway component GspD/PulD (secretin)